MSTVFEIPEGPPMPADVKQWAMSVEAEIPLLRKLWPEGMKDFTQGVPVEYQSGVFVNVNGWRDCKAKFGCEANALNACNALMDRFEVEALVIPPDDAPYGLKFWKISFPIPEDQLFTPAELFVVGPLLRA